MTKRICLFAGYDQDGKIDDYVTYYCEKLSNIADVYYYGDFIPQQDELKKLLNCTKGAYAKRHNKYDFGSWQELVQIIGVEKIREYDELILANDSCYGPLFPLENIFKEMDNKKTDFWGLSCSRGYHIHIQSYFLVFKKNIIKEDILFNFLNKVKPEKSLADVCTNYEERLTYILSKSGFRFSSYIPYGDFINQPYYNTTNAITKKNFPLLKVKTFYGQVGFEPIKDWEKLIKSNSKYDINLIKNNLYRRGLTDKKIIDYLYYGKRKRKKDILLDFFKKILKSFLKFFSTPLRIYVHKFVDFKLEEIVNAYNYRIDELEEEIIKLDKKINYLSLKKDDLNLKNKNIKYNVFNDNAQNNNKYFLNNDYFIFKNINNILLNFDNYGKDILFLGNFNENSCSPFDVKNNKLIIANSLNIPGNCKIFKNYHYGLKDLCNFNLKNNSKNVYFDLIFVEPFSSNIDKKTKFNIFRNLYNQMIDESILILNVKNTDVENINTILKDADFTKDEDAIKIYGGRINAKNGYCIMFFRKIREHDVNTTNNN